MNNKQKRDERIIFCKIWLIGDRCDGWEKQTIEIELKDLIQAKKLENQNSAEFIKIIQFLRETTSLKLN